MPDTFVNAEQIDHVALNVTDLERSAKWYRDMLGLEVLNKWDNAWLLCRGKIRLGIYICPGGQSVPDPDKRLVMRHYAYTLSAEDFIAAEILFKENSITYEGPSDTGVAWSMFIYDPDGYRVELTHAHAFTPST